MNNFQQKGVMDDKGPIKKKMKAGRVSPRSLFAFLKVDKATGLQQTNKNSNNWKPPLKANTQGSEMLNTNEIEKLPTDHLNSTSAYNSQPNMKLLQNDSTQIRSPIINTSNQYIGDESSCKQTVNGNESSVNCKEKKSINENNCIYLESSYELMNVDNNQSLCSNQSEEESFETLPYIDFCIKKEENAGKDICNTVIYEDIKEPLMDSESVSLEKNGEELKNDEELSRDILKNHSPDKLPENEMGPRQMIQSDSEELPLDLNENKGNCINNDLNYYSKNAEDIECFLQVGEKSSFIPLNEPVLQESNFKNLISAEKSCMNVETSMNENEKNTQIKDSSHDTEINCSSQEGSKCIPDLPMKNEGIENSNIKISSFDGEDPFDETVSNSQFLRLENEICSLGQNKLLNPGFETENVKTIHEEAHSLVAQLDWQKNMIRRMINEVDELNKVVMNATSSMKKLPKGYRK